MTFTVCHGKKIIIFQFGKPSKFRLGPSKNHGELLTNNQMLCFWQMGLKLHFYRISMASSWDSHPMDPWPLSEKVLFSNLLVIKAQSHFISEATARSIGSIFDGM